MTTETMPPEPMYKVHQEWGEGFEARLGKYADTLQPNGNPFANKIHGLVVPEGRAGIVAARLARIRRMLGEYRIRLGEMEHHLSRMRIDVEGFLTELPQYKDAKNEGARKLALSELLEHNPNPFVIGYRQLRDEVAWYKTEVSRIEVELEITRDVRRAMEIEAGAERQS